MEDTLPTALGITVIGMTLLFLALGLFYGLLALLTRVVRDRNGADEGLAETLAVGTAAVTNDDAVATRLRAAAIAVALARAEAEAVVRVVTEWEPGDTCTAGGWWAMHHGRRLGAPPSPWRGR